MADTSELPVDDTGARPDWPGVRLHVVTGKGGTGKTTVASALALTLASLGRKVLLVEVEGRQGISQAFDVPPLADDERLVLKVSGGGEIWGLAVDAKAALLEYLDMYYRLGRAGSVLERMGAVDFATTIAPGVRDVLLIGKVYEAVRRRAEHGRSASGTAAGTSAWVYDAVVLDAPPTGRVGHFLNVNEEVAELAKVGPIRSQADSVTRLLRSEACAVHLTTILEDMPVQETVDAVAELARIRVPLGAIVVNQARDELLSEATLERLAELDSPGVLAAIGADLAAAGLDGSPQVVTALVDEARDHAARLALEDEHLVTLAGLDAPLYVLPRVGDSGDPGGIRVLAQHLAEQGDWS
ncbi:ArsA-related P-loop ATPase [Mobilicoccus massiliensis]|uniref:ArsA-related P-loop ATPase n=1 Tax=Mobilicoccus massiliensis TaxID=1522310 RepID=UPI0006931D80|nr:ArsA-related P-loop ATPase [Mobilicoccus massiliensis]